MKKYILISIAITSFVILTFLCFQFTNRRSKRISSEPTDLSPRSSVLHIADLNYINEYYARDLLMIFNKYRSSFINDKDFLALLSTDVILKEIKSLPSNKFYEVNYPDFKKKYNVSISENIVFIENLLFNKNTILCQIRNPASGDIVFLTIDGKVFMKANISFTGNRELPLGGNDFLKTGKIPLDYFEFNNNDGSWKIYGQDLK